MSKKMKCQDCFWREKAFGYDTDCAYYQSGNKGRCYYLNNQLGIDIEQQYQSRLIDAEHERNMMIYNSREECYVEDDD